MWAFYAAHFRIAFAPFTFQCQHRISRLLSIPCRQLLTISQRPVFRTFYLTAAATAIAAGPQTIFCIKDTKDDKNIKLAIDTADALYAKNKYSEIKEYLESQLECECMASPEILWRLARAYYDIARELSNAEKKILVEKAFATISKALERGDDNFAVHKWYGIILNKIGEFQGTKATIQNSFVVKSHWERAAALNPSDATSSALLGEWCYNVAGLSAVTRAVAAAAFAAPPAATYTEALQHFVEAEGKEPGFWNKNRLMIAKCHLALGRPDQARPWLDSVIQAPVRSAEDSDVAKEAAALAAKHRR